MSTFILSLVRAFSLTSPSLNGPHSWIETIQKADRLSDDGRRCLAAARSGQPAFTHLHASDLIRIRRNTCGIFTPLGKYFLAIASICTDTSSIQEITGTFQDWVRNRETIIKSLPKALLEICFVRIGKTKPCVHVANVTQAYTESILLFEDMSEIVDCSCIEILEGQFLHGS